jgi:protein-S-isoprenylcysteine O-methyltransferase Ste14
LTRNPKCDKQRARASHILLIPEALHMKMKRNAITSTILTISAVGQIILAFILYDAHANTAIRTIGWVILWISAVFGWLPVYTLKRRGSPEGRGYVRTTVLVDRGIYAVVRHPQYLAGMLMGVALSLIAQHWIVAILGLTVIISLYLGIYDEERSAIAKFGASYERYRESVPKINVIVGLIRLLRRRRDRP